MKNRYAVILAGKVENIIVAEEGFALSDRILVASNTACIGDLYDGSNFTKPTPELPTQDQIIAAVQAWLDEQAKAKGYDGILSAASYATSTNQKFGPEGIAARDGRDATWAYCYEQLDAVESGSREPPASIDEFLSELTPVTWP